MPEEEEEGPRGWSTMSKETLVCRGRGGREALCGVVLNLGFLMGAVRF